MKEYQNKRLFIYGAGGLGREVVELAKQAVPSFELAFIDDAQPSDYLGIPVFSYEEACQYAQKAPASAVIATGEPTVVRRLKQRLETAGIALQTLIHPSVHIPESCTVGSGVVVQDRVYIGPNVFLGDASYINFSCAIGHDTHIGDCTNISFGALLGGTCSIGEDTYVGCGATIRDEVKIGSNSIIGLGSLVTKDIPNRVVAYGVPCKVVRENVDGIVFR